MKKVFGIILPYIMIVFMALMSFVEVDYKLMIEGFVVGLLTGVWFICLQKMEGKKGIKLVFILNILLFVVLIVLGMLDLEIKLLSYLTARLAYMTALEIIGYYIVSQNKPHLSMTYRYSYKNKRRRYF